MFSMTVRAEDTAFTNFRSKFFGSPTITIGEEFGDVVGLVSGVNMIELKNPRVAFTAVAAAFLSQVLKALDPRFAPLLSLVRIRILSFFLHGSRRCSALASVDVEVWVFFRGVGCSAALLAFVFVSRGVCGTFSSPIT